MRSGGTPMERAASMNGSSRACSTCPRVIRAKPVQPNSANESITLCRPGPSAADIDRMKISGGKHRNASVIRMIMASVTPPRKPANRPINTPSIADTSELTMPTNNDTRAP